MRTIGLCLIVGSVLVAGLNARTVEAVAAAKPVKTVALATVGNVPSNLVAAVQRWLADNSVPVSLKSVPAVSTDLAPAKLAKKLSSAMSADDLCLVVLVDGGKVKEIKDSVFASGKVGLVFLSALADKDASPTVNAETYLQRVDRQAMDAMAQAMGMPVCLFPQCALFAAENAGQLDAKARNLCPPCSGKLEKILPAQGALATR